MAQMSTALSDLVLASVAVYGVLQLTATAWDAYPCAVAGYVLIWFAAVAGMIRFGLREPPQNIYDVHRAFYWLSHTTSVVLIAAQAMDDEGQVEIGLALKICAVATCVSHLFLQGNNDVNFHDIIFFVAIFALGYITLKTRSVYSALGTAIFLGVRVHKINQTIESSQDYEIYSYLRAVALYCFARCFVADKTIDEIDVEM